MGGYYQVPVGYKFRPSEEELFLHYLLSRLNGEDYRKGVVPNCNLYALAATNIPEIKVNDD
ncbi:hypothetical protein GBA52_014788 [Prunus armeniaca]|nr:hypothetical protein GBA52_014788 [Prunus armeniaca]